MRIVSRSLTIAFLLSLGPAARAEEVQPYPACTQTSSDPVASGARAAFEAGQASFNENDYPRAILYWEDAFRRDCTATGLLLNLARVYELNGQKRQAVVALETFLQREPNTPEKAQINRRIEVLKKSIESEPPPAAAATPAASAAPAQPTAAPTEQPPPQTSSSKSKSIVPLVVVGVGGALFIVGGLTWLGATNKLKEYEDHCTDPEKREGCPDDEVAPANDARKQQTTAGVVTVVSIPIIAGGILWYAMTPKSTAKTTVTPAIGQNFLGLSVDGKF